MKIIKLDAIGSTNTYLKSLLQISAIEDKTIVYANTQLEGRGQREAKWFSETNHSLTFSVYKEFENLPPKDHSYIGFAVSIAILEGLKWFNIPNIHVKWPNDIMSHCKKVAGILVENQIKSNGIVHAVIGVGVNVNNDTIPNIKHATSLKEASGVEYKLEEIFKIIVERILANLDKIGAKEQFQLHRDYTSNLFRLNETCNFKLENGEKIEGVILGVETNGSLKVELQNATIETYYNKEIKMIL